MVDVVSVHFMLMRIKIASRELKIANPQKRERVIERIQDQSLVTSSGSLNNENG